MYSPVQIRGSTRPVFSSPSMTHLCRDCECICPCQNGSLTPIGWSGYYSFTVHSINLRKEKQKTESEKCTSFNWQNKLKLTVCEYMAVACMCPPWDIDGIPCTIYQLVCCARERERGRGRVWFGAVIWLRHQFTLGKMCCGTVCSSPAISLCTQIDDGRWK